MRLLCPYEPVVHPLTRSALDEFTGATEYVHLGEDRTAYWALLAELWAAGESFILIEHDVEIHERAIRALTHCPRPWCVFPYAGPLAHGGGRLFSEALGCTRFRSSLMRDHPDVMSSIGTTEHSGVSAATYRDWRGLDSRIAGRLRQHGHRAHVHWPEVLHHHRYSTGCSCRSDDCEERVR